MAAGSSLRAAVALVVALALMPGCARLLARPRVAAAPETIVAAGAARERALDGVRLTLSVRATAGPPAARLASPAYLAIDAPERLRLQVLSPFGVTVLALETDGDRFTLSLPLQNERREGRIDLAALAAGTTPEDERMIVALAVLFRPKMSPERCRAAGPATVRCLLTEDLAALVTVDASMRPIREEYRGPGDRPVLVADLTDYPDGGRYTLPGRITISDGAGGPALVVRVVRSRQDRQSPAPAGVEPAQPIRD